MPPKVTRVILPCKNCGIEFEVLPSRINSNSPKYCGRKCSAIGTGKKLTDRRKPIEDRFWEKVQKGAQDDCWIWRGGGVKGYGTIGRGGKFGEHILAHRLSWEIANGTIQGGMSVLHRCDTPPCVNPSHLFLGTRLDNNRDMAQKGRNRVSHPRMSTAEQGEKNRKAKLTAEQVVAIRERYSRGEGSYATIAKDYGVVFSTIQKIHNRERWTHI